MDLIDKEKLTTYLDEFARERRGSPFLQKYRDQNACAKTDLSALLSRSALARLSPDDLERVFQSLKKTHVGGIQDTDAKVIARKDHISTRCDFYDLLYGEMPFNTRYNRFRERSRGFGMSNITCMLSFVFPDEHITVDTHSVKALEKLIPAGMQADCATRDLLDEKNGGGYSRHVGLCKKILGMMWDLPALAGADLTTVHEFFYYLSKRTDA